MIRPYAVVIAGGRGERLGGIRKADLRIGGRRLLDRVAAALEPAAVPLLVATGPGAPRIAMPADAIAVHDLAAATGGPLAGLVASIAALHSRGIREGLLISAAVDTPFLPEDYVTVMTAELRDSAAALAGWGGDAYPPNAIWQIEALAHLPEAVMTDTAPRSLKALQGQIGARLVDWTPRSPSRNPFANVNSLADLLALQESRT